MKFYWGAKGSCLESKSILVRIDFQFKQDINKMRVPKLIDTLIRFSGILFIYRFSILLFRYISQCLGLPEKREIPD